MLPHQSPITFYPATSSSNILPKSLELKELMVYLKTTETCQLNCKHCFTNGTNGRKIYFDPIQTVKFLQKLHDFAPTISAGSIAFHGGEPMLAPVEDMMYVYSMCKDLWPAIWWTTTTNLAYKLDAEKLTLFKTAFTHGISTSWDNGIRFENDKQEQLWAKNVKTLLDDGHEITLIVSLSKSILAMPPEEFLTFIASTGVQYLHLERITPNGNAILNQHIMPSNAELDQWFIDLWYASIKLSTHKHFANLFFNSVLSSHINTTHSGCRCRSCEKKVLTINADGFIGSCPNSAVDNTFGHINDDIITLLTAPNRINSIVCESQRNPICYTCEVYDICNGDCHQLAWEADICAAPKKFMQMLKRDNNIELYREVLSSFVGQE